VLENGGGGKEAIAGSFSGTTRCRRRRSVVSTENTLKSFAPVCSVKCVGAPPDLGGVPFRERDVHGSRFITHGVLGKPPVKGLPEACDLSNGLLTFPNTVRIN